MIICCVGRARSGKDTVYNHLKHKAFPNLVRYSFADQIKQIGKLIFKIDDISVFYADDTTKETPLKIKWSNDNLEVSPRQICTSIGSFFRNNFSKDFWIDRMFSDIADSGNTQIIITDMRYPNELEYVCKHFDNVKIIYVDADQRLGKMDDNAHESEKAVYEIKEKFKDKLEVIENNGTLREFKKSIDKIII